MNVKELQVKIAKEFGLEDAVYEARKKSFELKMKIVNEATKRAKVDKKFDKWLSNLIRTNGTTKY
jgi:hypothetical protein